MAAAVTARSSESVTVGTRDYYHCHDFLYRTRAGRLTGNTACVLVPKQGPGTPGRATVRPSESDGRGDRHHHGTLARRRFSVPRPGARWWWGLGPGLGARYVHWQCTVPAFKLSVKADSAGTRPVIVTVSESSSEQSLSLTAGFKLSESRRRACQCAAHGMPVRRPLVNRPSFR
jgi:hypothetical protein